MSFSWDINFGNILPVISGVLTIAWAWHRWDKKIDIRHAANQNDIRSLQATTARIEGKVEENTDRTNDGNEDLRSDFARLASQISSHESTDAVRFETIDRRLGHLEERL